MWSEKNAQKIGEPTVGFSFMMILQHTSRFWSRTFLSTNNVTTLEHPLYSPYLAACDFYLFQQLKSALKGHHFHDATDIIKNVTEELKWLSLNG